MSGERVARKEKNHQNIQVFVRLRPLNQRERELRSLGVVEVSGAKEVIVRPHGSQTKRFTFDRAFGPHSKQIEVYEEVVSPLIEEVLSGYNCTVFAYGQTGTGKTHTMVGENMGGGEMTWQDDPMAGIIPRALSQLFDELRLTNSEYAVRVSYLELYNEELFDLLATAEDNSKLRIYEDATKKGSNIVNGLEEMAVYNKNEVYRIMEQGQERRRMAATLMNAQSSRSHTVFTILVHMKENSPEGEELMKVGKLNLVDLAGSENISKAGSDNPSKKDRARECVNINQSLLTLGRVITALVERHPHIPYRESKLTRLLQESLGGRTKTSIIATISPGHKDLEETLSTLEYANRAKNIQNKPEINQKMTKRAVLKEYSEEIDRLKRDLMASREKNGVHLDADRYAEIMLKLEDQEKDIQDKILAMRGLHDEKERMESVYLQMKEGCRRKEAQLQETAANLMNTKVELRGTKDALIKTHNKVEEQRHLVLKQTETEEKLSEQAKDLLRVAATVTDHVGCLHEVVDKRRKLEDTNLQVTRKFCAEAVAHRGCMRQYLATFTEELARGLDQFRSTVESHHNTYVTNQNEYRTQLNSLIQSTKQNLAQSETRRLETEEKVREVAKNGKNGVASGVDRLVGGIEGGLSRFLKNLVRQTEEARMKDRQMLDSMQEYVQGLHSKYMTEIRELQVVQKNWWSETSSHLQEVKSQYGEEVQRHAKDNVMHLDFCKGQKTELDSKINILQDALEKWRQRQRERSERLISRTKESMATLEREDREFKETVETDVLMLSASTTEVQQRTEQLLGSQDSTMQAIRSRVEESHRYTFDNLQGVQRQVREQVESLMEENKQNCVEQVNSCHDALDSFRSSHEATVGKTFNDINTITATSERQLAALSSATQAASETQSQWHESRVAVVEDTLSSLAALGERLGKNLLQSDEAEREFVQTEYGVYSPTGATPHRQAYRYPRLLAATSPHERILQRFRSLRENEKPDEDIHSENVNHNGSASSVWSMCDSELVCMSLGNVTTCPFVEPPPVSKGTPGGNQQLMVKATSESDIYKLVHKDGKENQSSGKGQFRSKLRKPTVKKPHFQPN